MIYDSLFYGLWEAVLWSMGGCSLIYGRLLRVWNGIEDFSQNHMVFWKEIIWWSYSQHWLIATQWHICVPLSLIDSSQSGLSNGWHWAMAWVWGRKSVCPSLYHHLDNISLCIFLLYFICSLSLWSDVFDCVEIHQFIPFIYWSHIWGNIFCQSVLKVKSKTGIFVLVSSYVKCCRKRTWETLKE